MGYIMFVPSEGSGKALVWGARREVKGLAPSVLIEISDEIVVGRDVVLVIPPSLVRISPSVATIALLVIAGSGSDLIAGNCVFEYIRKLDGHG